MKYLKRFNIDDNKWNDCIKASTTFVYPYTWYLDEVCEHWDALVIEKAGHYEACFPVPWKSKYGIKYVYPPFFCQQLGLFATNEQVKIAPFVEYLSDNFKLVELYVNSRSKAEKERCNLVLSLNSHYEELKSRYSKNHRRNLVKGVKAGIQFQKGNDVATAIKLFKEDKGDLFPNLRDSYDAFKNVCRKADSLGKLSVISAFFENKVIASAVFFVHRHRIIFAFSGNSSTGKELGALFLLLDHVIQEYQNSEFLLDFEGSEDDGLQRFYKGFGAKREDYYFLKINKLPFPINLLKK